MPFVRLQVIFFTAVELSAMPCNVFSSESRKLKEMFDRAINATTFSSALMEMSCAANRAMEGC